MGSLGVCPIASELLWWCIGERRHSIMCSNQDGVGSSEAGDACREGSEFAANTALESGICQV